MPNTNFQTIHQMGTAISRVVKQATGRDPVENIDMDYVTVAQNKTIGEMVITGNPASFHTGNSVPLQRILIGMEPIQPGSGDPSPDNIRPISGRTGVNISRYGKNMFPCLLSSIKASNTTGTWNGSVYTIYGQTIEFETDDNGYITAIRTSATAVPTTSFRVDLSDNGIVLPAGEYKISGKPLSNSDNGYSFQLRTVRTSASSSVARNTNSSLDVLTFTSDGSTVLYPVFYYSSLAETILNGTWEPMVRLASIEDDTFEPYTGENYSVTFPDPPGTVYGGSIDVITGKLKSTYAMIVIPEFTEIADSTKEGSTGKIVSFNVPGALSPIPPLNAIGERLRILPYSETGEAWTAYKNINNQLNIFVPSTSTIEDVNNAIAGSKIIYSTPYVSFYNLTPQEISTLTGDNTISTDGDTLEVMYYQYGEVI